MIDVEKLKKKLEGRKPAPGIRGTPTVWTDELFGLVSDLRKRGFKWAEIREILGEEGLTWAGLDSLNSSFRVAGKRREK